MLRTFGWVAGMHVFVTPLMSEQRNTRRHPLTGREILHRRTTILNGLEQGETSENDDSNASPVQYPPSARQTVADSRARGDTVVGETRPPLLVTVTGYRLLNTSILLGLGIWKTVASYRNEAILSTSLDLLLGVILAAM